MLLLLQLHDGGGHVLLGDLLERHTEAGAVIRAPVDRQRQRRKTETRVRARARLLQLQLLLLQRCGYRAAFGQAGGGARAVKAPPAVSATQRLLDETPQNDAALEARARFSAQSHRGKTVRVGGETEKEDDNRKTYVVTFS